MTVLFSTTEHGGRILDLADDVRVPRLTGRLWTHLVIGAVLCAVCATIVLPISLPPLYSATGLSARQLFWVIPLALVAVWGLVSIVPRVYRVFRTEFHQPSLALRAATIVSAAAAAVALSVWSRIVAHAADPWTAELAPVPLIGAGIAAATLLVALIGLPIAALRIARGIRTIVELRAHGERVSGEIVEREDPSLWVQDRPQFLLRIRYSADGAEHVIRASMSTTPREVPVVGSRVLVLVGVDGATHVEPDPQHPLVFERDTAAYRSNSDGGS